MSFPPLGMHGGLQWCEMYKKGPTERDTKFYSNACTALGIILGSFASAPYSFAAPLIL